MLESIRRHVAVPGLPAQVLVAAGTVLSFAWLLAQGFVHPLALYLLQLYLAF